MLQNITKKIKSTLGALLINGLEKAAFLVFPKQMEMLSCELKKLDGTLAEIRASHEQWEKERPAREAAEAELEQAMSKLCESSKAQHSKAFTSPYGVGDFTDIPRDPVPQNQATQAFQLCAVNLPQHIERWRRDESSTLTMSGHRDIKVDCILGTQQPVRSTALGRRPYFYDRVGCNIED